MISFQYGTNVFILTGTHLAYAGMVIFGIFGLFGAWWGMKWFSGKKQAKFESAMKTLTTDILQDVGEQVVRHLTTNITAASENVAQGVQDRLRPILNASQAGEKAIKEAGDYPQLWLHAAVPAVCPPLNDPGFSKVVALPSKIGDLFELERVMGRYKLWAAVREQTMEHIDILSAASAPLSTFDSIKGSLRWQTYGPNADQPLTPVRLIECDTNHLENILATQSHLSPLYYHVIISILRGRWLASR